MEPCDICRREIDVRKEGFECELARRVVLCGSCADAFLEYIGWGGD